MIKKILIVEDLPHVLEWVMVSTQTAFPNATIEHVGSVASAQKMLKNLVFDLVLLDIGLPDGSGLDLIPMILSKNADGLVVISSLFDDDAHVFKALRLGAKGYILKDESQAEMAQLLKNIELGHQPVSPGVANKLLNFFIPQPQQNKLTPRETDVLTSVAKGFNVPQTAEILEISTHTCYGYIKSIYKKLEINSRAEAALEATKMGLIEPQNH